MNGEVVLPDGTEEVWVESFNPGGGAVTFRFHLNPKPEEIQPHWKRVEEDPPQSPQETDNAW